MSTPKVKILSSFAPGIYSKSVTSAYYPYETSTEVINSASWNRHLVQRGFSGKPFPQSKPINPYTFSVSEMRMRRSLSHYEGRFHQSGSVLHPEVVGHSVRGFPPYNDVYNRLLDELTDKTRGSLDLSVDLAEIGSTARMFRALDHLDDFNRSFFGSSKGRRFINAAKWIGKQRLQYSYGVKPLMSSIYSAADESLRFCLNKTERFKVRAHDTSGEFYVSGYTIDGAYSQEYKATGVCKRGLEIGIELLTEGFDISRWTSLNPVSLAWELTPFSFVADWFVDVGSYLRNYETAIVGSNRFVNGYITELQAVDCDYSYTDVQPYGWTQIHDGSLKSRYINRSVLNDYPSPRLPSFKADLGSSRLLNSAALLSQLLGRRS